MFGFGPVFPGSGSLNERWNIPGWQSIAQRLSSVKAPSWAPDDEEEDVPKGPVIQTAGNGLPVPAPGIPAPQPRPLSFGPASPQPSPSVQPETQEQARPNFLESLLGGSNSDALLALGAGIMSGKNWGEGIRSGVEGMQRAQYMGAQTDLARNKVAQAQRQQNATAKFLMGQGYSPEQAAALMSSKDALNSVLAKSIDPNKGRTFAEDSNGVKRWTDTGAKVFGDDEGKGKEFLTETDAQGNVWQTEKGTGQKTLLKAGEKPVTPTLQEVTLPDGTKQQVWLRPGETKGIPVGAPTGGASGQVDAATLAKERAKVMAEQEGNALSKGQVAAATLPHLQRLEQAYERLNKMEQIGPFRGSSFNRWGDKYLPSGNKEAEALRQEAESAMKEIELFQASSKMKGQGSITDSERKILAMTLPALDAMDGATGLQTIRLLREALQNDMSRQKNTPVQGPSTGQGTVRRFNPATGRLE